MTIYRHPPATKKLILDLIETGLSNSDVAREVNKQLRGTLNRLLTKNAVIGIKNRAGLCAPRDPRFYPKTRKNSYDKSVAFNEHVEKVPYAQKVKKRLLAALAL